MTKHWPSLAWLEEPSNKILSTISKTGPQTIKKNFYGIKDRSSDNSKLPSPNTNKSRTVHCIGHSTSNYKSGWWLSEVHRNSCPSVLFFLIFLFDISTESTILNNCLLFQFFSKQISFFPKTVSIESSTSNFAGDVLAVLHFHTMYSTLYSILDPNHDLSVSVELQITSALWEVLLYKRPQGPFPQPELYQYTIQYCGVWWQDLITHPCLSSMAV